MNMDYHKINNLSGWICAAISTTIYILTMEPTTSWWDAGEFIAAAHRMQIVHQPGAPLFLLLQNVFSLLAFGNPERIAYWMNFGSALSSGLTILFLFWTITALVRKMIWQAGAKLTSMGLLQIMGGGAIGAMAYALSDTFWFSAVESEVYAMSSLCTAVVFWAILKWEARADDPGANRWLVFIAYIMGLSLGIHLLNLLTIPALALVIYFRKTTKVTLAGVTKTFLIGCTVLAFILWGVVQYLVKFAAYFDLFFVNTLGMGFGSGAVVFAICVVGALGYGIWYSMQRAKPILNIALVCMGFIIFGYSSFAMVLIRAKANPLLNNSQPDDAFSFLWYLNRGQFGSEPLVGGPYFDSQLIDIKQGSNEYRKGETNYEVAGTENHPVYDRTTLFPRIYSTRDFHPQGYRAWLGLGEGEQPRPVDNLKFLTAYQLGHMYWRYFMWNFAGRQNDQQPLISSYSEGNWISGINFIDQWRLGGQDKLPEAAKTDPSRNAFYFLPLILGVMGLIWQLKRSRMDMAVVGLLFFFTGLAIVLYLNQSPLQPRERDYAYAGSFYAFAIWIGMGAVALADLLKRSWNQRLAVSVAITVGLFAVPILMGVEGWDDHDRSQKYMARDMARNYLESCAPNAILFTYIDNDTFPLWYLQEVEGVRRDVRVVNLSLLGMDWQVRQMKEPAEGYEALPISMADHQFAKGTRDVLYYHDYGIQDSVELQKLLALLLSDNPSDQLVYSNGDRRNFLPTKNFKLTVDKEQVLKHHVVPEKWHDKIVDTMFWTYDHDMVTRSELTLMDILVHNEWKRPIYFTATMPTSQRLGLDDYLVSEGFALRLMPVRARNESGAGHLVNPDNAYENVMHKFTWGNMKDAPYLDPTSYALVGQSLKVFSDTAEMLITEGRREAAKDVVNRAVQVLPERIPLVGLAGQYPVLAAQLYELGETAKANALVERNVRFLDEQLAYYAAIAETKPNVEGQAIRDSLVALEQFAFAAEAHGQPDQQRAARGIFDRYRLHFFGS
ncbi:membrane protein [Parapedobacter pyrenivorans]|uniref:Membrane protein n=2 Tax=Parapedobacter pyrenivorans TaxID=1305674 RepID=A0A917HQ63_9SPHI|nr:membrane protein [Parapedobacter pyrenivorans]